MCHIPEYFLSCQPSVKFLCHAIEVGLGWDSMFVMIKDDLCISLTLIQGTMWLKNYGWSIKKFSGVKTRLIQISSTENRRDTREKLIQWTGISYLVLKQLLRHHNSYTLPLPCLLSPCPKSLCWLHLRFGLLAWWIWKMETQIAGVLNCPEDIMKLSWQMNQMIVLKQKSGK